MTTTGMIPDTKLPPARKTEMAASSVWYKKTQFILMFVWEDPQAQRGEGPSCPAGPLPPQPGRARAKLAETWEGTQWFWCLLWFCI